MGARTAEVGRLIELSAEAIKLTREGKRSPVATKEVFKVLQKYKENEIEIMENLSPCWQEIMTNIVSYWQKFYKELFGIGIRLNVRQFADRTLIKGFDFSVVTVEEVNEQMLFDKYEEFSPCLKIVNKDLDKVLKPDATTKGTHSAWFRKRKEADHELMHLSALDLEKKRIQGITLKQRLVMGLSCLINNRNYLDVRNKTLCSGSRYKNGSVPTVCLGVVNELKIDFLSVSDHYKICRSREVGSFS